MRVCSHQVHLEIDQFPSSEGDDHLMIIQGTLQNGSLPWSLPLIHPLVRPYMADPLRVHLHTVAKELNPVVAKEYTVPKE